MSFCGKIKKESGHGVMANIRAWGACDSGFESQCPDWENLVSDQRFLSVIFVCFVKKAGIFVMADWVFLARIFALLVKLIRV